MTPTRRKYDTKEHRSARKRLAREVAAGNASCWRCGDPISAGSKWHVGHDDAGVVIMGPEHAGCNLAAQNRLRAAHARAFTNGGTVRQPYGPKAPASSAGPTPRPDTSRWPEGFAIDEVGRLVVPAWVERNGDVPDLVGSEFAEWAMRETARLPQPSSRQW